MEKSTPHVKLQHVKTMVQHGKVRATASAFAGARALGFETLHDMCEVIRQLQSSDFYKSMTTIADHRIWQDVYHARHHGQDIYLKLTVIEDVLVVSFKEL